MLYNTSMRNFVKIIPDSPVALIVYVLVLIAIASIITIAFVNFLLRKSRKKYNESIEACSNTLRIFVVDVKNDLVNYFNCSYLRNKKNSSITAFYNQFASNQRETLISWIGDLLENKEETPKFLEIHVYIKSKKMNVPSILQVQKIDYKKQKIYLESHLLKYNQKSHVKGEHHAMVSREAITRSILTSNGRGATLCVNFFNKNNKTNDISRTAYIDLKNILTSLTSQSVVMAEHEFGKVLIADFEAINKIETFSFIDMLKSRINRFLLIESFADEIDYTISIIENSIHYRDVNNLIKNVVALSEYAKDEEQQVMVYSDKKALLMDDPGQQYRSDVEQIIQDNKLAYYFQPIYNFERKIIEFYEATAVPVDSYFKNIDDLKNYAMRTEDDKELFSTIIKNTISRFVQEKNDENLQLVIPISYNEIPYVNRALGHTAGVNDTHIVLLIKEKDLVSMPEDYGEDSFISTIRSFKSKGYRVALQIDDEILTLTPSVYSLFDYFNLSVASHIEKKNAGSQLPTFQGLIEKLLHYQIPIVATNIPNWDIVELVYKLGVNIIGSDAIALPDQNILPLPKKIIAKIKNLKS